MTDDRTIEHRISRWLDQEARGGLPDRVLETVFEQTRAERRRPSRFAGRFFQMSRSLSALVAVGAAAIVVILGVALLGNRASPGVGGEPSPSALAPSGTGATPGPSSTDVAVATAGPKPMIIATATYPAPFAVPWTMTWPGPVQVKTVEADTIEIHASSGTGFNVFAIGRVGKNPCTTDDLGPRVLTRPQEFMDWLATIPNVTAQPESQVTIGGHPALEREIDIGALTDCIDSVYLHSNIRSQSDNGAGGFLMAARERERWVALTVNGTLIAFTVWPLDNTAYVAMADQAIATIQFGN